MAAGARGIRRHTVGDRTVSFARSRLVTGVSDPGYSQAEVSFGTLE